MTLPTPDDLVAEEGTTFTIHLTDDTNIEAVLHTVDPAPTWKEATRRTNLYFHVPAGHHVREGTYRVEHPHLGAFEASFEEVQAGGRNPRQMGYRARPVA